MNKNNIITPDSLPENIYGHKKRLLWIIEQIERKRLPDMPKGEIKVLEIGCGTGVMISTPLASLGYDVTGVDTDEKSIELANAMNTCRNAQFLCMDAANLKGGYDFIILAEVLEHLDTPDSLLKISHRLLSENGILLVSVPNGYGWFEVEQFLWDRLWLGKIMEICRIVWIVGGIKALLKKGKDYPYPSTLSSSPHVQRFTLGKIKRMINGTGFQITEIEGSTLFGGKFCNLFFTGFNIPTKINNRLGSVFKSIASGYYLCCRKA